MFVLRNDGVLYNATHDFFVNNFVRNLFRLQSRHKRGINYFTRWRIFLKQFFEIKNTKQQFNFQRNIVKFRFLFLPFFSCFVDNRADIINSTRLEQNRTRERIFAAIFSEPTRTAL